MSQGLFITGTDTDVGKTQVTVALAMAFRASNRPILAFKPLETDCEGDGSLFHPGVDACALAEAAGDSSEQSSFLCLPHALAPSVSARLAGIEIDIPSVFAATKQRINAPEFALIEGAGGVMVPITDSYLYLQFMQDLAIPVLLVAANRLGVLSHTLMSVSVLKAAGLAIAGVVLNDVSTDQSLSRRTNFDVLGRHLGTIPLVQMTYLGREPKPQSVCEAGLQLIRDLKL